ncbi:MAG: hypothetical protein ACRD0G_13225 [Acidimicrobiales bacterium]
MSDEREPGGGLLGLLGVGMAVCCGLPILLGAGIAVGTAGLALGSAAVIAAGVALGVFGWRRRRPRRADRGKFCSDQPGFRDE